MYAADLNVEKRVYLCSIGNGDIFYLHMWLLHIFFDNSLTVSDPELLANECTSLQPQ